MTAIKMLEDISVKLQVATDWTRLSQLPFDRNLDPGSDWKWIWLSRQNSGSFLTPKMAAYKGKKSPLPRSVLCSHCCSSLDLCCFSNCSTMAIITFLLLAQIVSLVGAKALNYKPSVLKFLKPGNFRLQQTVDTSWAVERA